MMIAAQQLCLKAKFRWSAHSVQGPWGPNNKPTVFPPPGDSACSGAGDSALTLSLSLSLSLPLSRQRNMIVLFSGFVSVSCGLSYFLSQIFITCRKFILQSLSLSLYFINLSISFRSHPGRELGSTSSGQFLGRLMGTFQRRRRTGEHMEARSRTVNGPIAGKSREILRAFAKGKVKETTDSQKKENPNMRCKRVSGRPSGHVLWGHVWPDAWSRERGRAILSLFPFICSTFWPARVQLSLYLS